MNLEGDRQLMDDQTDVKAATEEDHELFVVLYLDEAQQEEISEPLPYPQAAERARALAATGFHVLSVATQEYGIARMQYAALTPDEKDEWLKDSMKKGLHGVLPAFRPQPDGLVMEPWSGEAEMPTLAQYAELEDAVKENDRAMAVRDEWQVQQYRHTALDWALRLAELNRPSSYLVHKEPMTAAQVVTQAKAFETYLTGSSIPNRKS